MFSYQKRLLFPLHVAAEDKKMAKALFDHYGGKDGEFTDFTRYFNQRLHVRNIHIRDLFGILAAEELSHFELMANVLRKLGVTELQGPQAGPADWTVPRCRDGDDAELIQMLKINEEAEERAKEQYRKHLSMANDTYLKRIIQFLFEREEIHRRLMKKAGTLLAQGAGNDLLSGLIHEYKMSLRVVK